MLLHALTRLVVTFALVQSVTLVSQPHNTQDTNSGSRSASKLTNKDVLDMQAAGIGSDVLIEKIKASTCDFDTSPSVLAQLKTAGVSEAVVLAMIRCLPSTAAIAASAYAITYVKSDRQWKYSVQHEKFDDVSEDFEQQLIKVLDKKDLHQTPAIDSGCCRVTLELLEVTTHPAMIKKPGIDASANVTVSDASGKFLYAKGYRGESRTLGGIMHWKKLISEAVSNMVGNITEDDNLIRVLSTGKL